MLLQPSSKPLPCWGEGFQFFLGWGAPRIAPSFILLLYMLKKNTEVLVLVT